VLLKFEKSRSQLQESLRRTESIVTEDIGCKVYCAQNSSNHFFLDQGERRPPDFFLKKLVPRLEPVLAQQTASLACLADQLHRESVGI
jgi:hypothetical protein